MKWHQSHMFRGLGNVDTFREYAALVSVHTFREVRDHSQASPLDVDVTIAVMELVAHLSTGLPGDSVQRQTLQVS